MKEAGCALAKNSSCQRICWSGRMAVSDNLRPCASDLSYSGASVIKSPNVFFAAIRAAVLLQIKRR